MTDLSDINMEGVKPMGDYEDLPVGTYLVRIEDSEKKETKERYAEGQEGVKLPPNHYLQIALKVYGGEHEGRTEFARLNLWNTNETAVSMAKSELRSIQEATATFSTNSFDLLGKWMMLEIKPGVRDPNKKYKKYHPIAEQDKAIVEQFKAEAPAIAPKAPAVAAKPATGTAAAPAPVSKGAPSATPSWAAKK